MLLQIDITLYGVCNLYMSIRCILLDFSLVCFNILYSGIEFFDNALLCVNTPFFLEFMIAHSKMGAMFANEEIAHWCIGNPPHNDIFPSR